MAELKVPEAKDTEETTIVTETTIVGVTESGVIRKRSVKRRISRDDGHKDRKYGHDKDEYAKIAEWVLADRGISSSVEVLQERWRMIMYMYDDCVELVKQWEDHRLEKQQRKRKRRLLLLAFLSAPVLLIVLTWFLARMMW